MPKNAEDVSVCLSFALVSLPTRYLVCVQLLQLLPFPLCVIFSLFIWQYNSSRFYPVGVWPLATLGLRSLWPWKTTPRTGWSSVIFYRWLLKFYCYFNAFYGLNIWFTKKSNTHHQVFYGTLSYKLNLWHMVGDVNRFHFLGIPNIALVFFYDV